MSPEASELAYQRALSAEILSSEKLRAQVLASLIGALLLIEMIAFALLRGEIEHIAGRPMSIWLPLYILGPFFVYECIVVIAVSRFAQRGREPPNFARYANTVIETSLPTVIIAAAHHIAGADASFGMWPSLFYFVFIVASTLRLNFALPMFTGFVAAAEYVGLAVYLLPLSGDAAQAVLTPMYHASKAVIMLLTGAVAGLVALRLRDKFEAAAREAVARERVTNLFGQHVSPAVVERLLDQGQADAREMREVCIMFLDIRDFTANARARRPPEVVEYLNDAFAFMIAAVDRHNGIINKFLGDGFMAVFGAPLDDPHAARHAVAAARDILAEIDRRGGIGQGHDGAAWPLHVRIGVHAGRAVTGNVGSPQRKEFTVIGDVVNFAARLEQLNKEHGSRLLVSETVMAGLPDGAGAATLLGAVTVRSYAEPIKVWRLDAGA
jgi:adenylate cyclase